MTARGQVGVECRRVPDRTLSAQNLFAMVAEVSFRIDVAIECYGLMPSSLHSSATLVTRFAIAACATRT